MLDTDSWLFQDIYAACSKGNLQVPPMPEIAVRLVRMADDPNVGLTEVSRVVQTDPGVAGTVMQAANSALYCAGKPVRDLKSAVVRLGTGLTRTLAQSFVLRQTFRITSPALKARMQILWEHSVDVSALSYALARKLKGFNPERALLAGLVHDVGVIPILTQIERTAVMPDTNMLQETIRKLRSMVGVLVASHWRLDVELTNVIADAEAWMRDPGTKPDMCDIVLVAQCLHFARTDTDGSLPELETLPAYRRLGLSPTDTQGVLDDAAHEVADIKAWLGA